MMNIKFPFAVTHKTKGEGTAVSLCQKGEDSYVIIDFGTRKEEFAYPDRFVYDLMAKDSVLQRELKNMYDRIHHRAPRLVVPGLPLGTRAIDVYDTCCKDFGWKMSKRGEFAQQQLLYAENATPEAYSVWMIVHSSRCERYDESITWYNFVKGDKIEEVWNGSGKEALFLDISRRVTFVKERSDGKPVYKFLGVYEAIGWEIREVCGKKRKVKIYQRVASTYPVEE